MKIGSISENHNVDRRVAITPEIALKYVNLGFKVQIAEKYGEHLGFKKSDYSDWPSVTMGTKETY